MRLKIHKVTTFKVTESYSLAAEVQKHKINEQKSSEQLKTTVFLAVDGLGGDFKKSLARRATQQLLFGGSF